MTTEPSTEPAIRVQGMEKSYKDLHVLQGRGLRGRARAASSRCSAPTARARPRSCGSCPRCSRPTPARRASTGSTSRRRPPSVRESISLTGQFAAVDEILTGRENLVLVARLRHLTDPGKIADDLLARFSLTDAGGRRAATYSGGMRRRLDIAMSLIGDPPIIFLDEPTTGLDPEARIEVWQDVKELADSGTTVLLTTQYLDEAEKLADRIAILHQGRIIVNGTLAELKALLPPAKVEYVEKQPTLEEIFLAIVGDHRHAAQDPTAARSSHDQPLLQRHRAS